LNESGENLTNCKLAIAKPREVNWWIGE